MTCLAIESPRFGNGFLVVKEPLNNGRSCGKETMSGC